MRLVNGKRRNLNRNYQPEAISDSDAGGLSLGYGFVEVGNLTQLQSATGDQVRAQYGYDGLNRLTQVMDGPTGTPIETYGYDATGNRTSLLNAGVTTAYNYPRDSHRLASVGGLSRSYDAAGNTTRMNGNARQFGYDASGRMTQVKAGNTVLRQYQYNAKGEQTRSYLDADNTYFAYDEAGHLLGEYDASGSPKQQILWFGDLPVGVLQGAGTGQQLHYIEPDHLGTPRVIIDGQRNVPIWEWSLTGEAFGNSPPDQNPDRDGQTFTFDLRFPGQRYDAATGLNYNYFRDYDAATGRYVESDPIGLSGDVSTYLYVMGVPVYAYDVYGLARNCKVEAVSQTGWHSSGETNKVTLKRTPLVPVCVPLSPKWGPPNPMDIGPDPIEYARTRKLRPSRKPPIPIEFVWLCKNLYFHKYILQSQELMSMSNVEVCRDDCGNVASRTFVNSYNALRWVSQGERWEIISGSEYRVNE